MPFVGGECSHTLRVAFGVRSAKTLSPSVLKLCDSASLKCLCLCPFGCHERAGGLSGPGRSAVSSDALLLCGFASACFLCDQHVSSLDASTKRRIVTFSSGTANARPRNVPRRSLTYPNPEFLRFASLAVETFEASRSQHSWTLGAVSS